ncbi:transposase [Streptomyces sp. NPDC046712]|uniref:transposase n=1 Tax=Streptomyces sp. NPDC046712 TaxID=3154802 RepID=UPI0033CFCD22
MRWFRTSYGQCSSRGFQSPDSSARGGTAPLPVRSVFTAIVYVLTSGCSWRHLPPSFGVSFQTAYLDSGSGPRPDCSAALPRGARRAGSHGLIDCVSGQLRSVGQTFQDPRSRTAGDRHTKLRADPTL